MDRLTPPMQLQPQIWLCACLLLQTSVAAPLDAPLTRVFAEGEHGIACWRIPALVDVTPGPRRSLHARELPRLLLAFAEARISACSDDTLKMVAMKRSANGGASWSPPIFVVGDNLTRSSAANSVWNPEAVYDAVNDVVVLSYLRNRTNCLARPGHCEAYQISSTDAVVSFGRPAAMRPALGEYSNGIRPGPGAGLVLTEGPKAGRILFSGSYDQLPKVPGERVVDLVWWTDQGKSASRDRRTPRGRACPEPLSLLL
eukprot:SAG11_NODE_1803_length_4235_cov_6.769342_2_plen_257_part_00